MGEQKFTFIIISFILTLTYLLYLLCSGKERNPKQCSSNHVMHIIFLLIKA
uniref:Uncharacterized protein n=1 Tax=Rhizophora mucronata TaxID=61149 RepID=A0A2P2R372_RHIMU